MCGKKNTESLISLFLLEILNTGLLMIGADSNRYEPQLIAMYYERETDLLCGQRPVFVNKLMVVVVVYSSLDLCGKS